MGRPLYESAKDREHEKAIAKTFTNSLGPTYEYKKLPMSYHVDYAIFNHIRLKKWLEVKKREISIHTYPNIMLSVLKYSAGMSLAHNTGTAFVFAIEVEEGIYSCILNHIEPEIRYGGRTKATRDPDDIEPVVHIPTHKFKKLDQDPF